MDGAVLPRAKGCMVIGLVGCVKRFEGELDDLIAGHCCPASRVGGVALLAGAAEFASVFNEHGVLPVVTIEVADDHGRCVRFAPASEMDGARLDGDPDVKPVRCQVELLDCSAQRLGGFGVGSL